MVKTKSPVEGAKANIIVKSDEPDTLDKKQRFTPEQIEQRVYEAKALANQQTPEPVLLKNLLNSLQAEDPSLKETCATARAKVQKCFGFSKEVGTKTLALKQSITERHFEAGEELEKVAWLLRGCFETWLKGENLPHTTSYRARALFKAAKNIEAVKGMTLSEAYRTFNILQPKQKPSLNKILMSIEKSIKRVIESGIRSADEFEASNCSAIIKRCLDQFETVAITCTSVVNAEATAEPTRAKTAGKKKLKVAEHQLMA